MIPTDRIQARGGGPAGYPLWLVCGGHPDPAACRPSCLPVGRGAIKGALGWRITVLGAEV